MNRDEAIAALGITSEEFDNAPDPDVVIGKGGYVVLMGDGLYEYVSDADVCVPEWVE